MQPGDVVTIALGHFMSHIGIFPGLWQHAIVPEDGTMIISQLASRGDTVRHRLRDVNDKQEVTFFVGFQNQKTPVLCWAAQKRSGV